MKLRLLLGAGTVLFFLAAFIAFAAWSSAQWRPFGDPLLDAVARTTRSESKRISRQDAMQVALDKLKQLTGINLTGNQGSAGPAINLGGLEKRWGADPRYWEARAQLEWSSDAAAQGMQRGVFSPALLQLSGLWSLWDKDRKQAVSLLQRATDAQPQNAYWDYRWAELLLDAGDNAGALDHLKAGNAKAECSRPRTALEDAAYGMNRQAMGPDAEALAGCWTFSAPLPNFIRVKNCYKAAANNLKQGGDAELADALWTAGQRRLSDPHEDTLTILVLHVELGLLLRSDGIDTLQLSKAQLAEMEEIQKRRKLTVSIIKSANKTSGPSPLPHPWGELGMADVQLWQETVAFENLRPQFVQSIAAFDKPPFLAWSQGRLAGYLTPAEAKAGADAAYKAEQARLKAMAERDAKRAAEKAAAGKL